MECSIDAYNLRHYAVILLSWYGSSIMGVLLSGIPLCIVYGLNYTLQTIESIHAEMHCIPIQ